MWCSGVLNRVCLRHFDKYNQEELDANWDDRLRDLMLQDCRNKTRMKAKCGQFELQSVFTGETLPVCHLPNLDIFQNDVTGNEECYPAPDEVEKAKHSPKKKFSESQHGKKKKRRT